MPLPQRDPPPTPYTLRDYVKPAIQSSLLAGAGYGAGYIAGGAATYALARNPKVQARAAARSVAQNAHSLGNLSHAAGTLSSLAVAGQHMVGEAMRREQMWSEWAKRQQAADGLSSPGAKHAADPSPLVFALRSIAERL